MRTNLTAWLITAAAAAALTACTNPTPEPLQSRSAPSGPPVPLTPGLFRDSRTDANAPEEVQGSADRLSCGEIILNLGETLPKRARTCFDTSIGKKSAELVIAEPTVEGDPLVIYYLTAPGLDGYDLITDGSRNRYPGGGWTHQRCRETTITDNPTNCSGR